LKKKRKQPSQVPPLDERHYLAIELLVDGKRLTRGMIAKKCGVSRMQLYRWELRKDFQQAYDKRMKAMINRKYPRKDDLAQMAINGDVNAAIRILNAADLLI
jgi:DNA-directed RNA polymerase specialized sigma subunit